MSARGVGSSCRSHMTAPRIDTAVQGSIGRGWTIPAHIMHRMIGAAVWHGLNLTVVRISGFFVLRAH